MISSRVAWTAGIAALLGTAALVGNDDPAQAAGVVPLIGPPVLPPSSPGATPAPAPTPAATAGDTSTAQPRPIARADTLSASAKAAVVSRAQAELNALGYGPLAVDGINGPQTQDVAATFGANHEGAVAAYAASVGNDRGLLYAIDDAYRATFGLGTASDFVPAPSAGIFGAARHRGRP